MGPQHCTVPEALSGDLEDPPWRTSWKAKPYLYRRHENHSGAGEDRPDRSVAVYFRVRWPRASAKVSWAANAPFPSESNCPRLEPSRVMSTEPNGE